MKFSTATERLQHQYAKLIPNTMWSNPALFKEQLDAPILELMSTDSTNLINNLNTHRVPQLPNIKRYLAWLALAVSHPDLNDEELLNIGRHLKLTNSELFYLVCIWGKETFFLHLCKQFPNDEELRQELESNRRPLFTIAAEHGHLDLMKFLASISPLKVEAMLEADKYDAFSLACRNNFSHVIRYINELTILCKLSTAKMEQMLGKYHYHALVDAAEHDNLDLLNQLLAWLPQKNVDMIKAFDYGALDVAMAHGHFEIIKRLVAELTASALKGICKDKWVLSLRTKIEQGHDEGIKALLNIPRLRTLACEHNYYQDLYPHSPQQFQALIRDLPPISPEDYKKAEFFKLLDPLRAKTFNEEEQKEVDAILELLTLAANKFFAKPYSKESYEEFANTCIPELHVSKHPLLATHRIFFGALFAALKQFFSALKSTLLQEAANISFFDTRTQSDKVISVIQEHIETRIGA